MNKPVPGIPQLKACFDRSRGGEPPKQSAAASYDQYWLIAKHFLDAIVQDGVPVLYPAVCSERR